MRKPTRKSPNRLHGHEITVLSTDPFIAILTLDTDQGEIEVAINSSGADGLRRDLAAALSGKL